MDNLKKFKYLGFVIMGFGQLCYGQFIKAALFLLAQISFIWFLVHSGISKIIGLETLGVTTQGWVDDPTLGIPVLTDGDNSMLFLIYGVATVMLCIGFCFIYILSLRSMFFLERQFNNKKHINTFKEDAQTLLDSRFHIAMLTWPTIGIFSFTIMPIIFMILIAFTNFDETHQPPGTLFTWVGLKNFSDMLGGNKAMSATFFPVLQWTIIWAIIATFSNYILGMILAMMINKKGVQLKKLWRTVFVITMAVPQFISILVMRNMLSDYGPVNQVLMAMTHSNNPVIPFLTDTMWARASVLTVNLWVGIPYTMLITTGILMNIPEDMYEAARIDGATAMQMFWKITLPQILFITSPYLITQFVGNINNFNIIYLLTGGNPQTSSYFFAGKTDLLVTWLFNLTITHKNYNVGAVVGIFSFIVSTIVALVAYRMTPSYKREDDFA